MHIRNRVIDVFERADAEPDIECRHALLTVVVAGGGFSGAELAGGLNDFVRGMSADYPNLSTDDLRVILVHSRERILPELSESLASYVMQRMNERGVTFRLNTRVIDARSGSITLSSGEERGLDGLWGMYQWLDRAPKGRNEEKGGIWWRRHDEYDKRWEFEPDGGSDD